MTEPLQSLDQVVDRFGAIVLDQWGVLHDGSAPYPGVVETVTRLAAQGVRLAVLSNSGKRAAPNAMRIANIGFDPEAFEFVMTSGEALWQDMAAGRVQAERLLPITRDSGDAEAWADGLNVDLTDDLAQADSVLLMGLPDAGPDRAGEILRQAKARDLPVLCTNPDRASPRAGGAVVVSPGALAHDLQDQGGEVTFYGKPHAPVFHALEAALDLPADQLLMVGDSFEHDIAGAVGAGWASAFIRGGLHATAFAGGDIAASLAALCQKEAAPEPTYTLEFVS